MRVTHVKPKIIVPNDAAPVNPLLVPLKGTSQGYSRKIKPPTLEDKQKLSKNLFSKTNKRTVKGSLARDLRDYGNFLSANGIRFK